MDNSHIASIKARFGIIGNSPALIHAISIADQVAATDMTVLITGESGSGKESFSKLYMLYQSESMVNLLL